MEEKVLLCQSKSAYISSFRIEARVYEELSCFLTPHPNMAYYMLHGSGPEEWGSSQSNPSTKT